MRYAGETRLEGEMSNQISVLKMYSSCWVISIASAFLLINFKFKSWPRHCQGQIQCYNMNLNIWRVNPRSGVRVLRFVIINPTWERVIGQGWLGFWDRRGWIRCEIKGLYSPPEKGNILSQTTYPTQTSGHVTPPRHWPSNTVISNWYSCWIPSNDHHNQNNDDYWKGFVCNCWRSVRKFKFPRIFNPGGYCSVVVLSCQIIVRACLEIKIKGQTDTELRNITTISIGIVNISQHQPQPRILSVQNHEYLCWDKRKDTGIQRSHFPTTVAVEILHQTLFS